MSLVAGCEAWGIGGWLMFPGNLAVYCQVLELKVCCCKKDSGQENDKGFCSEGRASVLRLMFLKWSDVPAIDPDGGCPSEVQDCLQLMSEI